MKRLELVAVFLLVAVLMAGCGPSGSGSSDLGSSAGSSGSSGISGLSTDTGSTGTIPSSTLPHHPEPATMALVATGLVAFVLLRRKKK